MDISVLMLFSIPSILADAVSYPPIFSVSTCAARALTIPRNSPSTGAVLWMEKFARFPPFDWSFASLKIVFNSLQLLWLHCLCYTKWAHSGWTLVGRGSVDSLTNLIRLGARIEIYSCSGVTLLFLPSLPFPFCSHLSTAAVASSRHRKTNTLHTQLSIPGVSIHL